jgi:pimeloyl-ACP methyl ester carboxylesterase
MGTEVPPSGPVWPVRLATHVWNPNGAAGQALLLHGLGSDGTTMWRLAAHLADRGYMVAAPDLRGHGRSPAADDHRLVTLAEDVAVLGAGWDLVVAHSLGGAVAAHLLARDDVAVSAALLIDPVLVLDPAAREPLRAAQRADVGRQEASDVAIGNPRWDATDVERKVLAASSCTPDVVDRVIDHNPDWDLIHLRGAWRARVDLLAADPALGALLDADTVAVLVDGVRTTGRTVAGAGHSVHRDEPAAVLAAIDALLEPTP